MLGLKLPTDEHWVKVVEGDLQEVLTDHAYCEQKAASNAITIIVKFPEYPELVTAMVAIAQEELMHFGQVHEKILARGLTLGRERPDPYVRDLIKFTERGGGDKIRILVDRLLFCAMIEARSCERFKVLSEKLADADLRSFYFELMKSEASHYTTFIEFARKYGEGIDVNARWKAFLEYEAEVIANYGNRETIHG